MKGLIIMDVGKRITQLRESKNMTTNKLANKAGISQSYLRQIELGLTNPTVEKLGFILEAMNLDYMEFFDYEAENAAKETDIDLDSALNKLTSRQKKCLAELIKMINSD